MGKKKEFDCEYNTTCDCSCDEQIKEDVIYAVTKIFKSYWNECRIEQCDSDDCD